MNNKIRITHEYSKSTYSKYRKIGNYYFYKDIKCGKSETDKHSVYNYNFSIKFSNNIQPINIDDYLKEIKDLKFIFKVPKLELDLIREYDNDIMEEKNVLFHDMRKEFIEVCEYTNVTDSKTEINIFFIGFTIRKNNVYFKIKTFDFEILRIVSNRIINHVTSNYHVEEVVKDTNMNWLTIDNLYKYNNSDNISVDKNEQKKLLDVSFKYENLITYISTRIMKNGFLTLDEMKEKVDGGVSINEINQMKILFKEYLKLSMNNRFVYLHQEAANNYHGDKKKNTVFSFSPRLLQYFDLCWYEEYINKCIKDISIEYKFEIIDIKRNNVYNFNNNDEDSFNTEFDFLVLIKRGNIEKIIAIECKRTLSKKEIDDSKSKFKSKIIESKNRMLIDGYIVIGFFLHNNKSAYLQNSNYKIEEYSCETEENKIRKIPNILIHAPNKDTTKQTIASFVDQVFTKY